MDWINIHTSMLRAPEYLGSEPTARATWLNVLSWCCTQENSGRIRNCRAWKDRQWQQLCGVMEQEINSAEPLLCWDGNDLLVWGYPVAKQTEVQQDRINGAKGGQSRSEAKIQASRANGAKRKPSQSQANPKPEPNGMEGNGREWKGKEENGSRANVAEVSATSDADWIKELQAQPAYQYLDVPREFSKMQTWCAANKKHATRRRFVNWLNRADKPLINLKPTYTVESVIDRS